MQIQPKSKLMLVKTLFFVLPEDGEDIDQGVVVFGLFIVFTQLCTIFNVINLSSFFLYYLHEAMQVSSYIDSSFRSGGTRLSKRVVASNEQEQQQHTRTRQMTGELSVIEDVTTSNPQDGSTHEELVVGTCFF